MPLVSAGKLIDRTRRSDPSWQPKFVPIENDEPPQWRERALADARDGNVCPLCLGLKWVKEDHPIGHDRFGQLFRCACYEGELTSFLQGQSGLVGWLKKDARLDNYWTNERQRQYAAVKNLLKKGRGWLALWGPPGRGKTFLLAAAVKQCVSEGKPAIYVTTEKLLDTLRGTYGDKEKRYSDVLRQWETCRVLALDDLDHCHATEWALSKLHGLLDYRYNVADSSMTLFASNAEPGRDGWPAELMPLYSRMTDYDIVECAGGDVRGTSRVEAL